MASRDQDEKELEGVVAGKLRGWLAKARDAVLAPFRSFKGTPDASAVYGLQPDWNDDVQTILTTIGKIALDAWSQATDVPPVSRHAFIMAHLADTENLLVRIPNEVANLVFAEITDAMNAGKDTQGIADAVDKVLSWTASERWPGRAKTIAITEATRARAAGTVAAGTEQARVTGRQLTKTWHSHHDEKVRMGHLGADNQRVPLWSPFLVGGEYLQFPGDPTGKPDNVINCRCDITIGDSGA